MVNSRKDCLDRLFSTERLVSAERLVSEARAAALAIFVLLAWNELPVPAIQNAAQAQVGRSRSGTSQFDLSNAIVPKREIFSGGPHKDGIPALSNPPVIAARVATYLAPNDRVIGVAIGGQARAYPLRILDYHEIVNDRLGGMAIAVSYCPLCDSAVVFDRNTPRGVREFGVSGLLYNSNVLMYDRNSRAESLWSQLKTEAISGPQVRNRLKLLPLELTTWSNWQRRHPATTVLSMQSGYQRNYARSLYGNYLQSPQLRFPVSPTSDYLPSKEKVLGVQTGGKTRAYPRSVFSAQRQRIVDHIDGKRLVVEFDPATGSLRVADAEQGIEWMYSLWFAWYAMHPATEVIK